MTPMQIKADRPYLRDYPHTASGQGHTEKHLRLVMGFVVLFAVQVHGGLKTMNF